MTDRTISHSTVSPQSHPQVPDLVSRLGHELISLSQVWFDLDPDDRAEAAASVGDAADALAPAIAAMRRSAPSVCVQVDVEVHASCDHPEARRG